VRVSSKVVVSPSFRLVYNARRILLTEARRTLAPSMLIFLLSVNHFRRLILPAALLALENALSTEVGVGGFHVTREQLAAAVTKPGNTVPADG
jgi:hypothetical protein